MENQKCKIGENRELAKTELELINEIKAKGQELLSLYDRVIELIGTQDLAPYKIAALQAKVHGGNLIITPEPDSEVLARHSIAEPRRWASIGKTELQNGIMALVRAVTQPTEF